MSKKKVYKTVQVPKVVYETQVIPFQVHLASPLLRHQPSPPSRPCKPSLSPPSLSSLSLSPHPSPPLPPSLPLSQVPRFRQVQRLVEVEHEEYEMVDPRPAHP
jgi:hypothetical protein